MEENGIKKVAYNVREAAQAMGVSTAFLYRYLEQHPEFPQLRLNGRIIIPIKRMEEYLNGDHQELSYAH